MSTIRSLRTGSPGSGSTVMRSPRSLTRTLQARRFWPLMSIASEPQMPWAHERRNAREPERSHWIRCRTSRTRSFGSTSSSCSSHRGFLSTSGSKRLMRTVMRMSLLVDPGLGLVPPQGHGLVVDADAAFVLVHQRVLQPVDVVALLVVLARVRAARLGAVQRGVDQQLGVVEQEPQLQGLDQLGVVDLALVLDADVAVALLQLGDLRHLGRERLVRAEDGGVVHHRGLQLAAELGD